jgi:hypothetical protein
LIHNIPHRRFCPNPRRRAKKVRQIATPIDHAEDFDLIDITLVVVGMRLE